MTKEMKAEVDSVGVQLEVMLRRPMLEQMRELTRVRMLEHGGNPRA